MQQGRPRSNILPFRRPRAPAVTPDLGDLRFRALVGQEGWAALPEAVRRRFSKRLAGGRTVVYAGEIVECEMSRMGWLLAQACRLIGAPLPLGRDRFVPASVSVTEDPASGGQFWTRVYGRGRGFPQVVHSCKRFAGPTGLEEYLGRGFGVALSTYVENGALHFDSEHYFLQVGRVRAKVPAWLSPGRMRVSHVEFGDGWFAFVLQLTHPRLGRLIRQTAMFEERVSGGGRP